jgi:predicted nucleic acid-binding protein
VGDALERVVIDSSVVIAGLFRPQSDSGRILQRLRDRSLQLVWDEATCRETRRLVQRIPPIDWEAVAELYRPEHRWDTSGQHPPGSPGAFERVCDPDDRKFARLAWESQAILLSLDAHLLEVNGLYGLDVRRPGML